MPLHPLRVGLFGIGLDAYWPQFPGLKEWLEGYLGQVTAKLARPGVEVVNVGLVDHPNRAYAAGREFRVADVDLIFLYVTTYALSSIVLPVVLRGKVPVIVLNLCPEPAIDYARFNAITDRSASRYRFPCGAREFVRRWNPMAGASLRGGSGARVRYAFEAGAPAGNGLNSDLLNACFVY